MMEAASGFSPSEGKEGLRILFVSPIVPWPPNLGASLRANSLLKALEAAGHVDCLFFGDSDSILKSTFSSGYRILDVFPVPSYPRSPFFLKKAGKRIESDRREWIFSYFPGFNRWYFAPETAGRFRGFGPEKYDFVFALRLRTLWWLRWSDPGRTIVDIDDVEFLSALESYRLQRFGIWKAVKGWRAFNLGKAQDRTLKKVSAALVCSEDDKKAIDKKLGNGTKIYVVPNISPVSSLEEGGVREGDSNTILFVGALVYKPNLDGLKYFIDQVFPLIRGKIPQVVLKIVGRTAPGMNLAYLRKPGVEVIGMVDAVAPYIENAALEICPLLFGEGTRIKILESLSYGKPVVSTTKGAHGIQISAREGLIRADNPWDFANACIDLISQPKLRVELGKAGQRVIRENYSQARVDESIGNILSSLL